MVEAGKTILLVEQNVRFGLRLATQGIVMESGRVLLEGRANDVLNNPEMADLYFGGSVKQAPGPRDRGALGSGLGRRVRALPEPQPARGAGHRGPVRLDVPEPRDRRRGAGALAVATEDVGRVLDADGWALAAFAAAGIVHFLLGWTFLNLSQKRIGAARTSPLLTMSPVFALAIAAIAVGQLPGRVRSPRSCRW